ncbi:hypothetical protein H2248_005383 [Termitomyces sp. 'cryptogamus']|nr:hypothetical protein H2248_005383 [Termitomyces sp. 'cryptogamus']
MRASPDEQECTRRTRSWPVIGKNLKFWEHFKPLTRSFYICAYKQTCHGVFYESMLSSGQLR